MLDHQAVDHRKRATIVPSMARSLLGLFEEKGQSPDRLCRGLGFTYQDLCDHEVLLSYDQVRELVLRALKVSGDPALGLAVGSRQTPVSWGVPGLAMLTCETLGEAMSYGVAHQDEAGALVDHLMQERGRELHIEVLTRNFDLRIESFLIDDALSGAFSVARCLVGPSFRLLRVDLAQQRPANEAAYQRVYRCPVRFDAGCNRITLESHWLNARLPGYDRITCGLVQAQLNTLLTKPIGRHDLVEAVANRVRFGVDALPTQRDVASMVNVSDRTLRRRLGKQAVTYRSLRDGARFERAKDLLLNSDSTVAQIAEMVGYSDARAFRRAFKRWSGLLPTEFRERTE